MNLLFKPIKAKTSLGFTLIELLVVTSIIAILTATGVYYYNGSQKSARDGIRKHNLSTIRNALIQYKTVNARFPFPPSGLGYNSSSGTNWIPELVPDYLQSIPSDPRQAAAASSLAVLINNSLGTLIENVYAAQQPGPGLMSQLFASTPKATDEDYWWYMLGFKLVARHDMDVSGLGGYFTGTAPVKLWDNSGNLLAQANVTSTNNWAMAPITPAVHLTAGQTYWLGMYGGGLGVSRMLWSGGPTNTADFSTIESWSYSTDTNFGLNHNLLGHGAWYMGTPDLSISMVDIPTPTPAPSSPSPSPSGAPGGEEGHNYFYQYTVSEDHQGFVLWAELERDDDPQINIQTGANCRETTPAGTTFNYCVKE